MKKQKKIALILGVTGQDGSFMAKLLLKKNYIVHGLIRKSATGNLKNVSKIIKNNKLFKIHHGDLLDFVSITNIVSKIKPDEIYNFADQDHVGWSFEIPTYSFKITALSVIEILEILKNPWEWVPPLENIRINKERLFASTKRYIDTFYVFNPLVNGGGYNENFITIDVLGRYFSTKKRKYNQYCLYLWRVRPGLEII